MEDAFGGAAVVHAERARDATRMAGRIRTPGV
jgi:hypothetical protein